MLGSQPMARFRTHLKQLMLNKSAKIGHQITQTEVANETKLSLPTISRWYSDKVDRLEADTLIALMKYFDCQLNDIVEITEDDKK